MKARLTTVDDLLSHRTTLREWFTGTRIEEVWRTLHGVERMLVMTRSRADLQGRLPSLLDDARRWCPGAAKTVSALRTAPPPHEAQLRAGVRELLEELHRSSDAHHALLRTVRNRLLATSVMALLAAAALVLVQWRSSAQLIPILDQRHAGGTAWWLLLVLVMVTGMVGAFIVQVIPTFTRPTKSSPYRVPFHVGLLKVAVAPLVAVLGLTFVVAGLVGTTADSLPKVLALAALFGASATLLTAVVDRNAREVLDGKSTTAA